MEPELKIEYLDPRELKPYERNARKHGEKDVEQIKESIRLDWFNDPIGIWGKDNEIVEGEGRQLAAIELGMDKVPCIRLDHLTDTQRRDYAIRHNRTAELSGWDWANAESEIKALEAEGLDMDGLGFDFAAHPAEWFDRQEKDGDARQEVNDEYNEFLEKFEQKKTTDDCYTPDNVYDAVADFVSQEYGVDRSRFVRPFYPGGDYKNEKYPEGCVVVDNPPFSILSEIIKHYCENGVKFFLFAPALTLFTAVGCDVEYMPVGVDVLYENGAVVKTSFVNNLGSNRIYVSAALFDAVKAANDVNMKKAHKELPKYKYPVEAVLSAQIQRLARYGQTLKIPKDECAYQNRLDAQKEAGKDSFGGLFLISEKAAAERAAAERAAAERAAAERMQHDTFELSDREKSEVLRLQKQGGRPIDEPKHCEGWNGDERERTLNAVNLNDFDPYRVAGYHDMPTLEPCEEIPDNLIGFNYVNTAKDKGCGVHFFVDDYQFERVWNDPKENIRRLDGFQCVFTPDFSLYTDMPTAMKVWNVYRSRLIGQMMQDAGLKVIPTLQWAEKKSFDYCFDGLPQGGVVAVSTVGVMNDKKARQIWAAGMREAIKRLKPKTVLCYGSRPDFDFGKTPVKYYDARKFEE